MLKSINNKFLRTCVVKGHRSASTTDYIAVASTAPLTVVKRENGVEHITLANPKTRNALSLDMMKKITEDISRAAENKTVRTIVLRGEGKVFSAGHNLKEMTV